LVATKNATSLKGKQIFPDMQQHFLEGPILVEEVMVCDAEPLKTGTMLKYTVLFESSEAVTACPSVKKSAGTGRVWSISGMGVTGQNTSTRRESCLSVTLSTTNLTWIGLE
jgi:hypothetical protein